MSVNLGPILGTGSVGNLIDRIKRVIPRGWFASYAPYRDAIIGGLSDLASNCYGLIGYARAQTRLATSSGIWLDVFSQDFLGGYLKRDGAGDPVFQAQIKATILQERVTRAGMSKALQTLTGNTPTIFEPWNTYDTSAYSAPFALQNGKFYGQMGYGVGRGGWGNMNLPCQVFMIAFRGASSGVAAVGGYGSYAFGYQKAYVPVNVGPSEYVGQFTELAGVTNAQIYNMIKNTKPSGVTCWVAFEPEPSNALPQVPARIWQSWF